ncbi:uncharacterized protein A1O9_11491 [Exophiala aquamarina CBS 119918]|uniref:Uncharacterized protein n=1 Tax=Exophiala aquamarina CBS 119918 TaxID=1182545 RepID=A0A072NXF1_9EURO|nr:uncharacterized protein A1O9_11491 [Exophiala aquamarina CBS 119918]KEF52251.1 hypothetical protein A1O9_11491 [Exophiala aquamarina CBS 119918]
MATGNNTAHPSAVVEMPRTAVVTGGGSGMGRVVAHRLALQGCTWIALLDQNEAGLAAVRSFIESEDTNADLKILTLACDVADESSVAASFETIHREFKRIDYAINCAGITLPASPTDTCSTSDFDRTIAVNLRGIFLCAREELRIMKSQPLDSEVFPGIPALRAQRGAIVNISSGLALAAMPNSPAYCASKAGVLALTRSDALDYAAHRIRVNAVLPGTIETPMTHANEKMRRVIEAHAVNVMTPMKRWGQAEEIADTCIFLCSNKASFIQGVSLPVDGGYTAI